MSTGSARGKPTTSTPATRRISTNTADRSCDPGASPLLSARCSGNWIEPSTRRAYPRRAFVQIADDPSEGHWQDCGLAKLDHASTEPQRRGHFFPIGTVTEPARFVA